MQELLWSFFSELGDYRTLPVPAQSYLKLLFLNSCTGLSVRKTKTFEKFGKR